MPGSGILHLYSLYFRVRDTASLFPMAPGYGVVFSVTSGSISRRLCSLQLQSQLFSLRQTSFLFSVRQSPCSLACSPESGLHHLYSLNVRDRVTASLVLCTSETGFFLLCRCTSESGVTAYLFSVR